MLKIELVEQTTKFNCGSAALAMILGLPSPEHVERDHLGRDSSANHADRGIAIGQVGVLMDEAQRVLFDAGIPALPYVNHLRCKAAGRWICRIWDRVRVADHDFLQNHLARGGAAMLTVPSLNTPGGKHWIVVAGNKVYDPSTGRKYRSYHELPGLIDAILIGERMGATPLEPKWQPPRNIVESRRIRIKMRSTTDKLFAILAPISATVAATAVKITDVMTSKVITRSVSTAERVATRGTP
jgi:hypothetical protein